MKIYTKQGDKGTTAVYTSKMIRLDKDDVLLDCYGTLDELNSHIGLVACLVKDVSEITNQGETLKQWLPILEEIQQQLFSIGFALSDSDKLSNEAVTAMETRIDEIQGILPAQTSFILPGGTLLGAHLHVARTIARRAERQLVSVSKLHSVNDIALAYVNRLSDLLFVLARYANFIQNVPDIKV